MATTHTNQEVAMSGIISTHIQTLALPLPGGRALLVALSTDDSGDGDLCLAVGSLDVPVSLAAFSRGVCVPASTLPALRDAFAALHGNS
jgi:hypothetical protein